MDLLYYLCHHSSFNLILLENEKCCCMLISLNCTKSLFMKLNTPRRCNYFHLLSAPYFLYFSVLLLVSLYIYTPTFYLRHSRSCTIFFIVFYISFSPLLPTPLYLSFFFFPFARNHLYGFRFVHSCFFQHLSTFDACSESLSYVMLRVSEAP